MTAYNYGLRDRLIAICSLPVLAGVLVLSMTDLRYWRGKEGPLQGIVVGSGGKSLEGVVVDSLNLDKKSVSRARQITDTYGRFVLDVMPDLGRPVYLSMEQPSGCHAETPLSKKSVHGIGQEGGGKNEQADPAIFVFSCYGK